MAELGLLLLGFLLGVWWFSVTILPIFYGLPKSIYWCSRGLFSWGILLSFLVPPIVWNLTFIGLAVVLFLWFPAIASRLQESGGFGVGQTLAVVGGAIYCFTEEGRRSLREDFQATAMRYVVTSDPKLLADFGYQTPLKQPKLIADFESRIETDLRWQRIEEIPGFPVRDFAEVRQKVRSGDISLGIDFTTANQLVGWLYGRLYRISFLLLAWIPYLSVLLAVVLAIALKSFVWLLAIPIIIVAEVGSNPYNPLRRLFDVGFAIAIAVLLWALFTGNIVVAGLSGFFLAAFRANRFLYYRNQRKLRQVALDSEPIFIYLYQLGKLGLKDRAGKTYWDREALRKEGERYLRDLYGIELPKKQP